MFFFARSSTVENPIRTTVKALLRRLSQIIWEYDNNRFAFYIQENFYENILSEIIKYDTCLKLLFFCLIIITKITFRN